MSTKGKIDQRQRATSSVSIVIVAREGFAMAPQRLSRLIELTDSPFRLIYVDGGSPFPISGKLKRIVLANGGTLIRTNGFLKPTQARNLGFRQVDTTFTVFLDNDVLVTEGWLDTLVDCADDTSADYVSPVVCQTVRGECQVHIAGGRNEILEAENGSVFHEQYAHMHESYADVAPSLTRKEVSMAEFHALLVRTQTLRDLGGLDECCSTAFEHNDLCLAVQRLGGKGWLEPQSIVNWMPTATASYGNFRYCLLRWSREWIDQSHESFCVKWGLRTDDPVFDEDLFSLHSRRRQPIAYLRKAAQRIGGGYAVDLVDKAFDRAISMWLRHQSVSEPRITLVN